MSANITIIVQDDRTIKGDLDTNILDVTKMIHANENVRYCYVTCHIWTKNFTSLMYRRYMEDVT